MLKLENDALRDDVAAGRRRLHISYLVSQCVKPPPPPADNAASPDQDNVYWDYFTLREADHHAKQLEGTQKYINEQCR